MAGWGKHTKSNGALIEIIQEVYTLTVDKTTCARSHPFEINEDKLCVFKSYGVGICYGDSGLPLVANGKLIGIASFGVPCAVGLSDIFTNVYACIDFIRSIVPYERS
ncbi:PREDICTED: chymotrypsin-2-like [Ceratosolen solmsi marchali]|uniref:Chymotrypsin-2-like n=1 Tax=Ceratosolen solmsi marchali TaxID=326594 RepID=A0AAJ7DUZ6_9HYME|nr:PREDICTED: chymotrypsin-2-like [Ceratosolen solmsi marchali]